MPAHDTSGSTSPACRGTSRSSWTATAAGRSGAACRASKDIAKAQDSVRAVVGDRAAAGDSVLELVRLLDRELAAAAA